MYLLNQLGQTRIKYIAHSESAPGFKVLKPMCRDFDTTVTLIYFIE